MRPVYPCDSFIVRRPVTPVQPAERSVRARRLDAGFTLAELGRAAGLSRNTVSRLERGLDVHRATRSAVERVLAEREQANRT